MRVVVSGKVKPFTSFTNCANPPLAVRAVKELAVRSQYMHIQDGLRLETAVLSVLRQSEDAKEGPRAFAEKRPGKFTGR